MPLECDGKEILEFKGIYLQKVFASKIKRQIPYTKVTKFLPLNSRGNLCNSACKPVIPWRVICILRARASHLAKNYR